MRGLCYFALYSSDGHVSACVHYYLDALRRAGFRLIVASAGPLVAETEHRLRSSVDNLLIRENCGLDFGSWADCYASFPPSEEEFLLLCNDSVYGPFYDLGDTLNRLTAAPADAYGFVASQEIAPHLQSWFLLMRPSAYNSRAVELFLNAPPGDLSKHEIIHRYEVGLSVAMEAEGLRLYAHYDQMRHGHIGEAYGFNPMHVLWDDLIEDGIPFLKADLIRTDPLGIGVGSLWRDVAANGNPQLLPLIEDDIGRLRGVNAYPKISQRIVRMLIRWDYRLNRRRRSVLSALPATLLKVARFILT